MVPGDVEEVCRGHLDQVAVQEPVTEPHRRHGDSRPQETKVTDTGLTAVALDLVLWSLYGGPISFSCLPRIHPGIPENI